MIELLYPFGTQAPVLPAPSAGHPLSESRISSEMLPIVDEHGIVIGQASREYCHGGSKLLHPVVHLHIINRYDELYLQKRSMKKDLLPGYWDTAVGGHVDYGEYISEAIFREASEELGFSQFNPIPIISYLWESERERELVNVYAAVGNFNTHPDKDEVEEGRYWKMDEIEDAIGKSILTPNFENEFKKIRRTLEALL